MEKIIEQVQQWKYLEQLPTELHHFHLKMDMNQRNTQYCIFRYINERTHRSFSVLYDHDTKEFQAYTIIGLTEFCDINFFAATLEILEKILGERLALTLENLDTVRIDSLESIVREKKIVEWEYAKTLPKELAGFEMFIKPWEPIRVINGSYIILDYSDFSTESNLIVYYNIYRDEFFGEIRVRRTPHMIFDFDSKSLDELEEKLQKNLRAMLQDLHQKTATCAR